MASLQGNTTVGPIQRAFYVFNTTNTTPEYIHMKTNIRIASISNDFLFYIEAEGYNYGVTLPILCSWSGRATGQSGGIVANAHYGNYYGGMTAHGAYKSSDSYLVLRAYSSNHYYNGFILNSYMSMPTFGLEGYAYRVSISAAAQVSNSGSYY